MGERAWHQLERHASILIVSLLVILAVCLIRNAWVGDDAYISFRTVDNFVNGYGLTWNVDERVQAFTNPLWVLLLSGFYFLTREIYYTSLLVSVLLTIITLLFLARRVAVSAASFVLAMTILLMSKAFIDYSVSGLENPLTHLILMLFCLLYLSHDDNKDKLFRLSVVASLGILNRMDTALLYLPVLIVQFWRVRSPGRITAVLMGFTPLFLWELFSIIYYGFPFPNTYYAKLHTGIPSIELAQQGLIYLLDNLAIDPITLTVILAGLLVPIVSKENRRDGPIAVGILLYLLYIVRIGGDFMSGRFLAAPLLCAVVLLSRYRLPSDLLPRVIPFAVVLLIGLTSPRSPLLTDASYGTHGEGGINERGIADERAWYYQSTGLLKTTRDKLMPAHK